MYRELCQQDIGALFWEFFPKWRQGSCQAKCSSSGAYLPAAAAMTNGGDSRSTLLSPPASVRAEIGTRDTIVSGYSCCREEGQASRSTINLSP